MKNKKYMHIICIAITLGFVALSVFVFQNAFVRIKESFVDLGTSVEYYFNEIFYFEETTETTINNYSVIPFTPIFGLPQTWEEFKVLWGEYWHIWATSENLTAYFTYLSTLLYDFSKIFLLVILPIILISIIFFKIYMSNQNNNYNKDSKPLKIFKWVEFHVYIPIKNWCKDFISFVKENNNYIKLWLLIWAYNFNLITIVVEFLAFYFYFVMSFNFQSIYIQLAKLFCDLSVMIAFIPPFIWLIIICIVIYKISKKIGYARLNHFENRNCGFINERPIVSMICGTMGKKKTTAITDMTLSQEKMFRDKAFDKLLENDMKFPYFPYINLENNIKWAIENHLIYNLATCKEYISYFKNWFYVSLNMDMQSKKAIRRYLKKHIKYNFNNLVFGYDYQKYGLQYDDKLQVVDVWKVIEDYTQLYFVYIIQSSLILSNYSVRTDNQLNDLGNFPLWDTDFFERDSKIIDMISRHSHIVDFDALRLGKKVLENNAKENSFDFGIIDLTEIGKERKNNLELKETKKNEDITNQKNDGFNDWLKMVRHSATIDNFPFVKVFTDEQRPESWGADARDLCEIVHIKETSDVRLAMPFFSFTELICDFIKNKFTNFYYKYRFNRGDNTLFMYLYKKFASTFYHFYKRTYNVFGYFVLDLQVESGTQDGILNDRQYYLMSKKIYSKRFSTDCFSDYFTEKTLKSKLGLNDLAEYETEKATFEELKLQNSYFINDLINKKGEKNEDKNK